MNSSCTLPEKVIGEAKILNINVIMEMGFVDCVLVQSFILNAAYKKKKKKRHTLLISRFNDMYFNSEEDISYLLHMICILFATHRMSKDNLSDLWLSNVP